MLNIENIDKFIGYLKGIKSSSFHMRDWHYNGQMCIGGHVLNLFDGQVYSGESDEKEFQLGLEERVANHLGITVAQVEAIAYPTGLGNFVSRHSSMMIDRDDAIKLIINLKETGKVDWNSVTKDWK